MVAGRPVFEIPGWSDRTGTHAGLLGRSPRKENHLRSLALADAHDPVWRAIGRQLARGVLVGCNQQHTTSLQAVGSGIVGLDGFCRLAEPSDGLLTRRRDVCLAISIADCVPVYLCVPERYVAVVHAGWRGVAGGILEQAVSDLTNAAACPPSQVVMHCGVSICGRCYEVGSEVFEQLGLPETVDRCVDLRRELCRRAQQLGLTDVTSSSRCTLEEPQAFYSYRGESGTGARMLAFMSLDPP